MNDGIGAHIDSEMTLVVFRNISAQQQRSLRIDMPSTIGFQNAFLLEVDIPRMCTPSIEISLHTSRNRYMEATTDKIEKSCAVHLALFNLLSAGQRSIKRPERTLVSYTGYRWVPRLVGDTQKSREECRKGRHGVSFVVDQQRFLNRHENDES
jgi:hypothetical protein